MYQTLRVNSRVLLYLQPAGSFNGGWRLHTVLDIQSNTEGRFYKMAYRGDWRWWDYRNLQNAIIGVPGYPMAYRGDNIPQDRA